MIRNRSLTSRERNCLICYTVCLLCGTLFGFLLASFRLAQEAGESFSCRWITRRDLIRFFAFPAVLSLFLLLRHRALTAGLFFFKGVLTAFVLCVSASLLRDALPKIARIVAIHSVLPLPVYLGAASVWDSCSGAIRDKALLLQLFFAASLSFLLETILIS